MRPLAFYAPLKSPNHPNPSGDREIARSLMQALVFAGFDPELVSEFRTLEKQGDDAAQAALIAEAHALVPDLIAQGRDAGWSVWVTYHNYYKAPDLLGPAVARALGIPFVQIEATRARKRLGGPWDRFARAAEAAADAADALFFFTQRDAIALRNYAPPGQRLVHLHPFLPELTLPEPGRRSGSIFTAAMMRPGDKQASYEVLAQTLQHLTGRWHIEIAGDGPARPTIEAALAPVKHHVTFLGQLNRASLAEAYGRARIFLWPGVNEAIGMVYLEAQAAGLPVVAQNRPGLIDVLAPHLSYPHPAEGPAALAQTLQRYLDATPDPDPIREYITAHHLLPAAAATLGTTLTALIEAKT